jgi:hypothetical protein
MDGPFGKKVIPTYLLIEAIDGGEYSILPDASKDLAKIIVSCGNVDMNHSSKVYGYLISIFATSPVTLANLELM